MAPMGMVSRRRPTCSATTSAIGHHAIRRAWMLDGDGRECCHSIDPHGGRCLQVGGDACASARVESRDAQTEGVIRLLAVARARSGALTRSLP